MTPVIETLGPGKAAVRAARRRSAVRRVLLSVWAFVTLVLVFCVILLAVEMVRQGQDPLASVKKTAPGAIPPPISGMEAAATKDITLFFASADGRQLAPELGRIDFADSTVENCHKALEALIRGPREPLTPILPSSTKIRGMYLLDQGELVLDLSMELESELKRVRSASLEGLMVYGIVNTLTQPALQAGSGNAQSAVVNTVRFLIEGAPPREAFPAHVDVSLPAGPNPEWVARAQE
jgi:hypothetical protein